ncbi:hypothetical protein CHK_0131 [Christensenella hongkongensis]|uniref:Uncharacterized protein n=1 Tax=Christensenella hongkongensis TaxID=270498 RepID=A0A0M2NMY3_9FIRM|nr:hypothetical protein CHK_0131 [Christensenella hongkongensis]
MPHVRRYKKVPTQAALERIIRINIQTGYAHGDILRVLAEKCI